MTMATEEMRNVLESSLKRAPFAQKDGAEIRIEITPEKKLHVEVVSPAFLGESDEDRNEKVWPVIRELGDEYVLSITLCMLMTPAEAKMIRSSSQ